MSILSADKANDEDFTLAQRVLQRYVESPGVISMNIARTLTRRADEWGLGRLPLLNDLQSRLSPETLRNGPALSYAWPNLSESEAALSSFGNLQEIPNRENAIAKEKHFAQSDTKINRVAPLTANTQSITSQKPFLQRRHLGTPVPLVLPSQVQSTIPSLQRKGTDHFESPIIQRPLGGPGRLIQMQGEKGEDEPFNGSVHKTSTTPTGHESRPVEGNAIMRVAAGTSHLESPVLPLPFINPGSIIQRTRLPVSLAPYDQDAEVYPSGMEQLNTETLPAKANPNWGMPSAHTEMLLSRSIQPEALSTMPMVPSLQRSVSDVPPSTQPTETPAASSPSRVESVTATRPGMEGLDLERVADEVYRIIERRLTIERESLGL